MSDLSAPRETGSEKASGACAQCGGLVPLVLTAYGSTAPGACPRCWPATGDTQLAAQQKAAAGFMISVPPGGLVLTNTPKTSSVPLPSTGDDE